MHPEEENERNTIIMNIIIACKYEEFELIKVNTQTGKRSEKLIAIDQNKIYDKTKKELTN